MIVCAARKRFARAQPPLAAPPELAVWRVLSAFRENVYSSTKCGVVSSPSIGSRFIQGTARIARVLIWCRGRLTRYSPVSRRSALSRAVNSVRKQPLRTLRTHAFMHCTNRRGAWSHTTHGDSRRPDHGPARSVVRLITRRPFRVVPWWLPLQHLLAMPRVANSNPFDTALVWC